MNLPNGPMNTISDFDEISTPTHSNEGTGKDTKLSNKKKKLKTSFSYLVMIPQKELLTNPLFSTTGKPP